MQWVVGQEYRLEIGYPAVISEIMPDGMMFGRYLVEGVWQPNAWRTDGKDWGNDGPAYDLLPPRPPVEVSDAVLEAYERGGRFGLCSDEIGRRRIAAIAAAIEAYLAERDAS